MIKLEKLVGTKQKVFYPWEGKSIERVIRKDEEGFYILYKNRKVRLRPMYDGMGTDMVGFEAIHGRRQEYDRSTGHSTSNNQDNKIFSAGTSGDNCWTSSIGGGGEEGKR